MKTTLLLLLLAAPAAATPAVAQVTPPVRPLSTPNTVTVSGEATVSAPPDRARVTLGVETTGEEPRETLRRHEEQVEEVLTAVRQMGIADRFIEIQSASLGERYGMEGAREGYVASRFVVVTIEDLRQVPDLVATVVEEGANRLAGLEYFLEDDDAAEDAALQGAFGRARAKAAGLASAAGARLGPVVMVVEQGVQPPMPLPVMVERMQMDGAMGAPGAYSTGSSEVHAVVVVTFALETP